MWERDFMIWRRIIINKTDFDQFGLIKIYEGWGTDNCG